MAKITGTAARNILRGTSGADTIIGLAGNDVLFGGLGDDLLAGGLDNDTLYGQDGNDSLHGDKGADHLDGGAGFDWALYFDGATAGVHVYLFLHKATGGAAQGDTLFNIENVQGTKFADALYGDVQANFLAGNAGNDKLLGREGDDNLFGGDGADTLDGGAGIDWALYKENAKKGVIVSLFNNLNGLGAAGDKLFAIENVQGTDFADALTGDARDNFLSGEGGNDRLFGRDGNDTFDGGTGADRLDGGVGQDWVLYSSAKGSVTINLATNANAGWATGDVLISIENVQGSAFADRITGDAKNNVLEGGKGNDTISGGGGSDQIAGGLGADKLDGGDGVDWLLYAGAAAGVSVNLTTGATGGGAAGDVILNFELVQGSQFGDTITGNATGNVIDGLAGNDHIFGLGGDDTLDGGTGADVLDGGEGTDYVVFKDATQRVVVDLDNSALNAGFAAGDIITNVENVEGTKYNDKISGSAAANVIFGGAGNDELHGRGGSDTLIGGDGNDSLFDEEAANASDNDLFAPGAGIDTVTGDGNDTVDYSDIEVGVTVDLSATGAAQTGGGADGDTLVGILSINGSTHGDVLTSSVTGHGTDVATVRGLAGDDTITLNHNGDRGFGDADNDTLILKASGQRADGGAGNDTLDASAATNASLFGGAGTDTLTGNLAATDFFVLELNLGADTITNFVSGASADRLAIQGSVYGFASGRVNTNLLDAEFLNQAGGTIVATGTGPQFSFDTVGKGVWFDDDGAGAHAAVQLATLDASIAALARTDFLIF